MCNLEGISACEGISKAADLVLQTRHHVKRTKKSLARVEHSISDLPWDAAEVDTDHGPRRDEIKALQRAREALNLLVAQRQQLRQELTVALKQQLIAEAILHAVVSSEIALPVPEEAKSCASVKGL